MNQGRKFACIATGNMAEAIVLGCLRDDQLHDLANIYGICGRAGNKVAVAGADILHVQM